MYKVSKVVAVAILVFISSSLFAAQQVDINKADVATIAENLNGIGVAKAKAIVAYRSLHGNFRDADDLIKVKGVGSKLVERNRSLISFAEVLPSVGSANKLVDTKAVKTPAALPVAKKVKTPSLSEAASN